MNTPKLIVLSGLPGSGKTTYAKGLGEKDFAVVSSDSIRDEFFGGRYSDDENDEVFGIVRERVAKSLLSGKDTVIDAVHATPFARMDTMFGIREEMFMAGTWDFAFYAMCIVIETPLSLCLFRNGLRDKPCPKETVMRMQRAFQYPDRREGFSEVKSVYIETNSGALEAYSERQKEKLLPALKEIRGSGKYTLSGRCTEEAAQDIDKMIRLLQNEKEPRIQRGS